jgi:hypothetical protein
VYEPTATNGNNMKPSTNLISYFSIKSLGIRVTCTQDFKRALEESVNSDLQYNQSTFTYVDTTNKDDIYETITMMMKYYGLTFEWNQSILELGYVDPTDCIRYDMKYFELPIENLD